MENNQHAQAIISMERYNELLRIEKSITGYGGIDFIYMTLSSFGWCKSEVRIYKKDEAIEKLRQELDRYQKENRELVESLRDVLREKPGIKEKFNIFSKIPTSWLHIKK